MSTPAAPTPAAGDFNTPFLPQPLQPSATSQALLKSSVGALPDTTPKVLQADVPVRVLITGAARGIGLELTRQYAAANPKNVVFAGVRDVKFDRIVALAKQYSNITIVELDVSSEASVKASVQAVTKKTDTIDILFNNAGIAGGKTSPATTGVDALIKTFTTNAVGPLLVTQAYLPLLKKSSIPSLPPRVINISSAAGSFAFAGPILQFFGAGFDTAYSLSKASLNYINTAFAASEPEIIFVSVSPGWVSTEMGYAGAPVTPEGSVQAIRAHVERYTKENSGQFRDIISGELLPL